MRCVNCGQSDVKCSPIFGGLMVCQDCLDSQPPTEIVVVYDNGEVVEHKVHS